MMLTQAMYAFLGGLAINFLNLMELQTVPKEKHPDFKSVIYWLPYIIWPLLGVLLACAYYSSGIMLKPILSLNIGASAPLILRALAQVNPISPKIMNPGPGA